MENITEIRDDLWVGGDPVYSLDLGWDTERLLAAEAMIIDVRSVRERYDGWDSHVGGHLEVAFQPMYDDGQDNSPQDFIKLWEWAEALEPEQVLFVHCHMGVNRSPSMVMFLLMVRHGMDPIGAFDLIRNKREIAMIAYATEAVTAALELGAVSPRKASMFSSYLDSYWTPPLIASGRAAIAKRRLHARYHVPQQVHIDDVGKVHITKR